MGRHTGKVEVCAAIKIYDQTYRLLRHYVDETGIPLCRVASLAIREYLKSKGFVDPTWIDSQKVIERQPIEAKEVEIVAERQGITCTREGVTA
jgi:hypothetical protein